MPHEPQMSITEVKTLPGKPLAGVGGENGRLSDVLRAGERIGELKAPVIYEIEGVPHAILPAEREMESLEHLLQAPRRIAVCHNFEEVAGFCEYVNSFRDADTRLYLLRDAAGQGYVRAVLNDHAPGKPSWTDHAAHLQLVHTDEWSAWLGSNREMFGHVAFVEFLQEQLHTIAEPAGADILDAAREFSAHRKAQFQSVVPVEGGDLSVGYSEETRGGGTKEGSAAIPSRLKLALRPFRATDDTLEIEATVNWRLVNGSVKFFFALLRTERVLEDAVRSVRERVEQDVGLKVLA